MLIAIPNFGQRVSPRIDCAESLRLIKIEHKTIVETETIKVLVHNILERINLIVRLKPDVIICDGISDLFLEKLSENEIRIIPWVHGTIDEILQNYLADKLKYYKIKN